MRQKSRTRPKGRGQSFVEFALTLPILLLVSMGIMDFGRALFAYASASNQIRESLRAYSLNQIGSGNVPCTEIAKKTRRVYFASGQTVKIQFMDQDDSSLRTCRTDTDLTGIDIARDSLTPGDLMIISNTVRITMLTPFFPRNLDFTITGQRTIVKGITLSSDPNDSDFDGLDDTWECNNFDTGPLPVCDPNKAAIVGGQNAVSDSDSDGCNNGCEESRLTDPNDPDTDGDGLKDGEEAYTYGTNPLLMDTDGDDDDHTGDTEHNAPTNCTTNDFDEVTGTDTSNPRNKHSDNDGVNNDGVDDWLEICRYGTDPNTVEQPIGQFYIENWPEHTNCGAGQWGMQWSEPSPVASFVLDEAGTPGTFSPAYPLVYQCSNDPLAPVGTQACPGSGPDMFTARDYFVQAIWGIFDIETNALANFNFTCNPPKAIPTYVTTLTVGPARSCAAITAPEDRYENLQWDWDFDVDGDTVPDVDGFYIYAQNGSGAKYRVGKIPYGNFGIADPNSPDGLQTVECTGSNGGSNACWNIAEAVGSWDPSVAWAYTIRPYITVFAIGYEPMVGYESSGLSAPTCP